MYKMMNKKINCNDMKHKISTCEKRFKNYKENQMIKTIKFKLHAKYKAEVKSLLNVTIE